MHCSLRIRKLFIFWVCLGRFVYCWPERVVYLFSPIIQQNCPLFEFTPLDVVTRYRDPQLWVSKNYSYLFNLRPKLFENVDVRFKHSFHPRYQWFDRLIKQIEADYSRAYRMVIMAWCTWCISVFWDNNWSNLDHICWILSAWIEMHGSSEYSLITSLSSHCGNDATESPKLVHPMKLSLKNSKLL